jgi:hypothetical protein
MSLLSNRRARVLDRGIRVLEGGGDLRVGFADGMKRLTPTVTWYHYDTTLTTATVTTLRLKLFKAAARVERAARRLRFHLSSKPAGGVCPRRDSGA